MYHKSCGNHKGFSRLIKISIILNEWDLWAFSKIRLTCSDYKRLNFHWLFHRIKNRLRLEGTSAGHLDHPFSQAGPLRNGCPGPRPGGFWGSPRLENVQLMKASCASDWLITLMIKIVSWCSEGISCVSLPIDSGSVTGHHWRKLVSTLFTASLQVLVYIYNIFPKPSLLQGQQSSCLQLSSQMRCSWPLIPFVALHCSLSSVSMSYVTYSLYKKFSRFSVCSHI